MARLIVLVPWPIEVQCLDEQRVITSLPGILFEDDIIILYLTLDLWLSTTKVLALLERLKTQVILVGPNDDLLIQLTSELKINGKFIPTTNHEQLTGSVITSFLQQTLNPNALS